MDAAAEAHLKEVFSKFDKDHSGLIDLVELQEIVKSLGIKVDPGNAAVLLRRYDNDKKGKLNFDEFEELYLLLSNLQKQFQAADVDKSSSLTVKELTATLQQLKLKVTPKSIEPVLKLYDDDGSGKAEFQEYLALVFFLQELEYQYDYYVGEPKDYNWVLPLLGVDNEKKIPDVTRRLKDWKDKKRVPTFEEFVDLFVKNLEVSAFVRFFTRKKKNAPKIEVVRDMHRVKAPKRHIKVKLPPVVPEPEEPEEKPVVHPPPVQPLPVHPSPVQPTPVQPAPVQPLPVQPLPVQPLPVQPLPVQPLPVQPVPVQPSPPVHVAPSPIVVKPVPVVVEKEYVDSVFHGTSIIPSPLREDVTAWKRPRQINEKAALFVDGVGDGDVIQGALGDCWFLGALAVVATSTDNFVEQLFTVAKPEIGKYQCRFYKDGKWVLVDIDDTLPISFGDQLEFASCKDPAEFWVPLVEKAYAKLHGSYAAIEKGSITDGLKDLTGEAVEVLLLDDPTFHKKNDLWSILLHNIKESFLMGCSAERGGVEAESELQYGVLVNHAYSVIDIQEVLGHKLLRIRNPWGKGEWTGPWSDRTKEWTPELLRHFSYDFANDGTFFICYEDFVKNFNRLYVLRLLTDKEGEVWTKSSFQGEFKGASAGGSTSHASWTGNPQYAITATKPTKVFLNISQPDIRYKARKNPSEVGQDYLPIGIIVMKADGVEYKKTSYKPEERIAASKFAEMRDNSLDFTVTAETPLIIMPCTFNPGGEFKYELTVYTQYKSDVHEITKVLPTKSLHGSWNGKTAGGCQNEPTWLNNPQFLLEVDKPGNVVATLVQQLAPNQKPESIGIYVFVRETAGRFDTTTRPTKAERIVMAGEFPDLVSVSERFQVKDGQHYIIMPTTFDPVTRDFTISVSSADTNLKTFALL